jgi:hypothetical protein
MVGIYVEFLGNFLFMAHVETFWVMIQKLPTETPAWPVASSIGLLLQGHITPSCSNAHCGSAGITIKKRSYLLAAMRIVIGKFTSLATG